ncbi:hypothetical protein NL488_27680, partial [Klebsiella pneumoniae]|nr:hypothetical protein [Klebsiella pneumoniae]
FSPFPLKNSFLPKILPGPPVTSPSPHFSPLFSCHSPGGPTVFPPRNKKKNSASGAIRVKILNFFAPSFCGFGGNI